MYRASPLRTWVRRRFATTFGQDKSRKRALSRLWTEVRILVETVDGRPNLGEKFGAVHRSTAQNECSKLFPQELAAVCGVCRHDHERWKCARATEECEPFLLYSATISLSCITDSSKGKWKLKKKLRRRKVCFV